MKRGKRMVNKRKEMLKRRLIMYRLIESININVIASAGTSRRHSRSHRRHHSR